MTEPDRCECGIPLADHPPLPKVRPLTSWMSAKHNRPPTRPGKQGKPVSLGPRRTEVTS